MFIVVLVLRRRLRHPMAMTWLVIALLAVGRFAEFFVRSDSDAGALGLETAQWTSLGLVLIAAVGAMLTTARRRGRRRSQRPA